MSTNGEVPLAPLYILERTSASVPAIVDLDAEISKALSALALPEQKLRGRRIAVSAGSRGIASLPEIVRAICAWLKAQGAEPFVFPAMGSHGGATGEGQRRILADYGVTPQTVGAEVRSSMQAVCLGTSPEGFRTYLDRNASEADGVIVMNRIKPHTDFSGTIESGLLKMMSVGMGKIDGAGETHRNACKVGYERAIRAMSAVTLASGKILCGVGVVENEFHQICLVRAAPPERIVAQEEETLAIARTLVPRIPFPKFQLLIVDELGKNISGAGMDTKVIGRGVELQPGEAPEIRLIYVRDVTAESEGNAVGLGFADFIHERLFRKMDLEKVYINARTALTPAGARVPMYFPDDQQALVFALANLGGPEPHEQSVVWIRNTLNLGRLAISPRLAREVEGLRGWRVSEESHLTRFDPEGNLASLFDGSWN